MPTKGLSRDDNRTIEIYFASKIYIYIIKLKVRKFQQSQLVSLAASSPPASNRVKYEQGSLGRRQLC